MKLNNIPTYNSINTLYRELIVELLTEAPQIGNTLEIDNCRFCITNPKLTGIDFWPKKFSTKYMWGELNWYWSGSNSCAKIGAYSKFWLNLSDDGITSNSAYGYIIQNKYGYNQLEQIIELLSKDKNTRRAVLNISDPTLNKIKTKDMQCTLAIQFLIRNNELIEIVNMRSNDVNFGLPYDYIFFVSLGEYIANRLNIKFSKYIHNANSIHMYLKDKEKFISNLGKKSENEKININIKDITFIYDEQYKK